MGPRLRRCGKCLPCNRGDCGSCHNCADKPKFGGSGVKKQACVARRCVSMLRREDANSPPPCGVADLGASPSGVLDLWDPASWNQPLGSGAVCEDVDPESFSYSDVLGDSSALLHSGAIEDEEDGDKDEMNLRMGWSESCLAAVEMSMNGAPCTPPPHPSLS